MKIDHIYIGSKVFAAEGGGISPASPGFIIQNEQHKV